MLKNLLMLYLNSPLLLGSILSWSGRPTSRPTGRPEEFFPVTLIKIGGVRVKVQSLGKPDDIILERSHTDSNRFFNFLTILRWILLIFAYIPIPIPPTIDRYWYQLLIISLSIVSRHRDILIKQLKPMKHRVHCRNFEFYLVLTLSEFCTICIILRGKI